MVSVVSKTNRPLMPTNERHARRLLKSKRAEIYKRRPFTVRLLDMEDGETQPIEYKCDTGYQHIGVSICTEKRELYNLQFDLLQNEAERHNDRRKYRNARRSRKRYRKARFNNRKGLITKDGFAPSIRNKRDVHIDIFRRFHEVLPITEAVFEMGQFDTKVLKAVAEGKPMPEGTDYQHGERYGIATLREAVFTRDSHTCICCGRTPFKDKAILHVHHVGFWKNDRTDRMGNLATICEKCHTSRNHKPGRKLWGLEPKFKPLRGATFMTMVRFDMFKKLKAIAYDVRFHMTYGASTKLKRKELNIKKSHSNDAYCMGDLHPKHRTDFWHYRKLRRNNRILEKFYDATYTDIRDGKQKKGAQLGCNRTKRNLPRNNDRNERIYRGHKASKGRRAVRTGRYPIQPGDRVLVEGKWSVTTGSHCKGTRIMVDGKSVPIKHVKAVIHHNGWIMIA